MLKCFGVMTEEPEKDFIDYFGVQIKVRDFVPKDEIWCVQGGEIVGLVSKIEGDKVKVAVEMTPLKITRFKL